MRSLFCLILLILSASNTFAQDVSHSDWSGLYVGVQTGNGSMDFRDIRPANPPHTYEYSYKQKQNFQGGHIGYQYDFGKLVIGAELTRDIINVSFDTPNLNSINGKFTRDGRILTMGYDSGKALNYFGFGSTQISNSDFVTASSHAGKQFVFGITYKLSKHFLLGARYETTKYEDFDRFRTNALPAPSKLDNEAFQLRLSYKF